MRASGYKDDRSLFAKRFFDHPAISAKNYASALHHSYFIKDPNKELFQWLLAKGDRQDLEVVKKEFGFPKMNSELRKALNAALKNVSPHTRSGDITGTKSPSPERCTH